MTCTLPCIVIKKEEVRIRIDIVWVIITAVASKVGRGMVSELQTLQSSDISLYPL